MSEKSDRFCDEYLMMAHDVTNLLFTLFMRLSSAKEADEGEREGHIDIAELLARKAMARIRRTQTINSGFTIHRGTGLYPVNSGRLLQIVRELVHESELLYSLRFLVNRASIVRLSRLSHALFVPSLVEQALRDVIDNARWYKYPDTTVEISASIKNFFFIEVKNTGIGILDEEIPLCTERGWRSDRARSVRPGGTGLGLWSADNIMRAHEGVLRIDSSDENRTTVALGFPLERCELWTDRES